MAALSEARRRRLERLTRTRRVIGVVYAVVTIAAIGLIAEHPMWALGLVAVAFLPLTVVVWVLTDMAENIETGGRS